MIDEILTVVIDEVNDDEAIARSYMDAPDIDNIVIIKDCCDCAPGDTVTVKITSADEYQLFALLALG